MDLCLMRLLPDGHAEQLRSMELEHLEEIRLSAEQPMSIILSGKEHRFWPKIRQHELEQVLQRACRQSVYAHTETIRQGYLPLEGGHRIGICGTGVVEHGSVEHIQSPSSLVIRVAKEIPGCADRLLQTEIRSTLIVGPPGSGKTTLLRDSIRLISDKLKQRVGVADERGELSAMVNGTPQLQIGGRTDVMINVPKAEAVLMLLRTMTPRWIALDEITAPQDAEALIRASYCGVCLLATAHGSGVEDLYQRPLYRQIMDAGIFSKLVLLREDKSYTIQEVSS